jgi:hypothetical protein
MSKRVVWLLCPPFSGSMLPITRRIGGFKTERLILDSARPEVASAERICRSAPVCATLPDVDVQQPGP